MKKLTIIIAFAFVALSISSCTKDYTCSCTTTVSSTNPAQATVVGKPVVTTFKKASHHDASVYCVSTSTTKDQGVIAPIYQETTSTDCTLK